MRNKRILEEYIILTTVNKRYLKIFEVWMEYFNQLHYTHILHVITYDKESEEYISRKGIRTIRVYDKVKTPNDIFYTRLKVILEFLKQGKHVVHTDADAFWLKDVLPAIANKDFDLQISIGYGIPESVLNEWGFVLCCGFYILHSNKNTINFFDQWMPRGVEKRSDQRALNELLLTHGMKWNCDSIERNTGCCSYFNLSIQAIDFNLVSRKGKKGVWIYHPSLKVKYEQIKLRTALSKLMKIDDSTFLEKMYSKSYFNLSIWHEYLLKSFDDRKKKT